MVGDPRASENFLVNSSATEIDMGTERFWVPKESDLGGGGLAWEDEPEPGQPILDPGVPQQRVASSSSGTSSRSNWLLMDEVLMLLSVGTRLKKVGGVDWTHSG